MVKQELNGVKNIDNIKLMSFPPKHYLLALSIGFLKRRVHNPLLPQETSLKAMTEHFT